MKFFLNYTFVIEGLTGIGLLLVPSRIMLLLMDLQLTKNAEIVICMLAGAAILSLAIACRLFNKTTTAFAAMQMILFYNVAVTVVFLIAALGYRINGPAMWVVIIFHSYQSVAGLVLLNRKESKK